MSKKIFILLPDGVGLRNFAFTNFYQMGIDKGFDIVFWNNTAFPLKDEFNFEEIQIKESKTSPLTDIYKRVRNEIELKRNAAKFKNNIYLSYLFTKSFKGLKTSLKSVLVMFLVKVLNSERGILHLRNRIIKIESTTRFYKASLETLKNYKPDFVFCTNQRTSAAIAPILAAKKLGIPTATFIFSWDNLPKGTLVVEADYYFVWSDYMKAELKKYYPFIKSHQIKVVGTPQFEVHFNNKIIKSKSDFFRKYKLDESRKYICFSGDDITTSPYDQFYLKDVAESIRNLNTKGHHLGLVFRRCPVDISDRFDSILNEFKDIIVPINPEWKNLGESWNAIMPMPEDLNLLVNTVKHTEFVLNIGSSMVFDYACHNKPCVFLNYNHKKGDVKKWNIKNIYKFIHFKSMPTGNAVLWVDNKESLENLILKGLENPDTTTTIAKKWLKKINIEESQKASENIWNAINEIIS